jgi:hypothetical protein
LSKRLDAVGDHEDASGVEEGEDNVAAPVLAAIQPLVGQQPGAVVLDDAADGAEPRSMRLPTSRMKGWMPSRAQSPRFAALS